MSVVEIDPIPRDTSREAAAVYYAALTRMRPHERVASALKLSRQLQCVLADGVRRRNPQRPETAVWQEVLRRCFGEAAFQNLRHWRGVARMSDLEPSLTWIIDRLELTGIPYMVAGSLASTYYGEYRATADVDLVIAPAASQLEAFLDSLGDDFYASRTAAQQALQSRTMFNVIHPASGFKADLIVRKERPFSVEEFGRRAQVSLLGRSVYVASPEDVILSKLEWSKAGESERQFRDALGIAIVQWSHLDNAYLARWGRELEIQDLLGRLLREAQKFAPME
ncbi:MAG: hypothetical protein HUU20_24555 [Pirellulales bacterium]|nr:hypothetical protein [Pirellulales bacterium]